MKKRRHAAGELSPAVVALLDATPKKFGGVRRHIIAHGTLPKGCYRASRDGQFAADLKAWSDDKKAAAS